MRGGTCHGTRKRSEREVERWEGRREKRYRREKKLGEGAVWYLYHYSSIMSRLRSGSESDKSYSRTIPILNS